MKTYSLICATSVPSESIFGIAGYIQRKERCRLSSKMLRFFILTKQNNKLDKIRFKTIRTQHKLLKFVKLKNSINFVIVDIESTEINV